MRNDSATPAVSFGRRAASYWFVDGLPEIVFGVDQVIFAALAFLWYMYAQGPWRQFAWVIVYVGLILYLLMERGVLDFLKSHVTYPRTGYVQPPEELEWRVETITTLPLRSSPPARENVTSFRLRTVGAISWFYVLLIPLWIGNPPGRWLVPCVMPAMAVTLYAVNRRSERPDPWWSALILALTGAVFLWVDVPAPLSRPLPFLLAGAWLAAQGGYRLVHYLRTNPYPRMAEGVKA